MWDCLQAFRLRDSSIYGRSIEGGDVDIFEASDISPDRLDALVLRNRPCLVRGGAAAWRACGTWDLDYLQDQLDDGDATTTFYRHSLPYEDTPWVDDEAAMAARNALRHEVTVGELLEKMASSDRSFIARCKLSSRLLHDVDELRLPIRQTRAKNALHYSDPLAYLYKGGSVTDFHSHPGFEALMVQVRGDKDVLLLPPDIASWRGLAPALADWGHSARIPDGMYPLYDQLRPTRLRVRAGDILYIPTWWWHAVETVDDDFGVTVPVWWSSPPRVRFDPRFPQADYTVWRVLPSTLRQALDPEAWREFGAATVLARVAFTGALFMTPLPLLTSLMSGSRFGRRPEVPTRTSS